MSLLKLHYKRTVKKDLSSRFFYNNIYQIPKIKKMTLNIGCKESSLKHVLPNILCLEFLSSNYPCLTQARKSSILFNLKKNAPNGVKLTLNTDQSYKLLEKFVVQTFANLKNKTQKFLIQKKDSFSFSIETISNFQELTFFYNLFKTVPNLDVTLKITSSNSFELAFFLTSFKLPGFYLRK